MNVSSVLAERRWPPPSPLVFCGPVAVCARLRQPGGRQDLRTEGDRLCVGGVGCSACIASFSRPRVRLGRERGRGKALAVHGRRPPIRTGSEVSLSRCGADMTSITTVRATTTLAVALACWSCARFTESAGGRRGPWPWPRRRGRRCPCRPARGRSSRRIECAWPGRRVGRAGRSRPHGRLPTELDDHAGVRRHFGRAGPRAHLRPSRADLRPFHVQRCDSKAARRGQRHDGGRPVRQQRICLLVQTGTLQRRRESRVLYPHDRPRAVARRCHHHGRRPFEGGLVWRQRHVQFLADGGEFRRDPLAGHRQRRRRVGRLPGDRVPPRTCHGIDATRRRGLVERRLRRRYDDRRPDQLRIAAAVSHAQRQPGQLARSRLEHGVRRRHPGSARTAGHSRR